MSRMLVKSLHPCLREYPILFIWRPRRVVLAGNGPQGRKLAEMALWRMGAVDQTDIFLPGFIFIKLNKMGVIHNHPVKIDLNQCLYPFFRFIRVLN